MENKKMTVAFVGCGKFAKFFVPLCQNHPYVEKVYVCDLVPEKAKDWTVPLWRIMPIVSGHISWS